MPNLASFVDADEHDVVSAGTADGWSMRGIRDARWCDFGLVRLKLKRGCCGGVVRDASFGGLASAEPLPR